MQVLGRLRLHRGGMVQTEDQFHFMAQVMHDYLQDASDCLAEHGAQQHVCRPLHVPLPLYMLSNSKCITRV